METQMVLMNSLDSNLDSVLSAWTMFLSASDASEEYTELEEYINGLVHPALRLLQNRFQDAGRRELNAVQDIPDEVVASDDLFFSGFLDQVKKGLLTSGDVRFFFTTRPSWFNSYHPRTFECLLGVALDSNQIEILDFLLDQPSINLFLPLILREISFSESQKLLPSLKVVLEIVSSRLRHRDSIGGHMGDTGDVVEANTVGRYFPLVNRNDQCDLLFNVFLQLERERINSLGQWDSDKRSIKLPVIAGMPGLGKTRFAREGIYHKFELLKSKSHDIYTSIEENIIDKTEQNLAISLAHACISNLNLRIDCSGGFRNEDDTAKQILLEWARPFSSGIDFRKILENENLTIQDAIDLIFESSPKLEKGDRIPSIILNIDEAQDVSSSEIFPQILTKLVQQLTSMKRRVFVVVSGLKGTQIEKGLIKSSMKFSRITLPTLLPTHCIEILHSFFNTDGLSGYYIEHLLWWLGGVPRFLEFFVRQVGKRSSSDIRTVSRKKALSFLKDDLMKSMDTFESFLDGINSQYEFPLTPEGFDVMFDFAVTGLNVSLSQKLFISDTKNDYVTVEQAQADGILYWCRSEENRHLGQIIIHPLAIRQVIRFQLNQAPITLLSRFAQFATSRTIESTSVSMIMRKLRCFHSLNYRTVKASYIGITDKNSEEELTVPDCFALETTDRIINSENFVELCERVRKEKKTRAFLNMGNAHFADSFIILDNIVIFIQEKQSITSNRKEYGFGDNCVLISEKAVQLEYERISVGIREKCSHIFLFVSDNFRTRLKGDSTTVFLDPKITIFSREDYNQLLGDTVSYLRKTTFSSSDYDYPPLRQVNDF